MGLQENDGMSTGGKNKGRRRGDDVFNLTQDHQFFEMATIVIHRDGVFLWASRQAELILGGPVTGRHVRDHVGEEFHSLMDLVLGRILATGRSGPESTIRYISLSGESLYIHMASYPVIWQGEPAILSIGTDKSDIQAMAAFIFELLAVKLSPREMEFMILRARKWSYGDISQEWGVDRLAVKNYKGIIKGKLKTDAEGYEQTIEFVRLHLFYTRAEIPPEQPC
ncbi:MAG: hypothetical protein CVV44_04035 [Spirochaetae bacterium HGW-Spirochaetae-1]|nr:MAG: hypothetical protein CVV44_04035 [Spirochaetae bacterium HGW-Spirochaetae-1]